ncbi:hypothetical protein [Maribacter sp. R77961]|uniref:hypothetical protein n=1 Tax=Maribacter sp. R77961 TaxID=3093871 RepID=UPI0037C8F460
MKVSDFTYFLEHPNKVVDPVQTKQLEDIIEEYPYFQSARALHLKGLKNLNSYKYNKALKVTAAYTTDRDVLFDFITSKDFLHNNTLDKQVITKEVLKKEEKPLIEDSADKPLPQDKKDAEQILDPKLFKAKKKLKSEEETLEIGKPLPFDKKEKYSFTEWLQLASKKPIAREVLPVKEIPQKKTEEVIIKKDDKQRKFDRIDTFIATNPKIIPKDNIPQSEAIANSAKLDKNELMTETLARVYLEQKKYKNAIQAYKILSLKYPEKSGFFADRIKAVEKIKRENS